MTWPDFPSRLLGTSYCLIPFDCCGWPRRYCWLLIYIYTTYISFAWHYYDVPGTVHRSSTQKTSVGKIQDFWGFAGLMLSDAVTCSLWLVTKKHHVHAWFGSASYWMNQDSGGGRQAPLLFDDVVKCHLFDFPIKKSVISPRRLPAVSLETNVAIYFSYGDIIGAFTSLTTRTKGRLTTNPK